MKKIQKSLNKFQRDTERAGESLSKSITLPLGILSGVALKASGDFEVMRNSLITAFGGSQEAAAAAQKVITDFTSKTPFQLAEVTQGFLKLKNLGLDPSESALRSYGNTAVSMGKSLNDFIEAVADASTNEFERLKEFGIKAKKQGDEVAFTFKGITTTVGANSREIQAYLKNIGDTDFAGGIERQAATLPGIISTLRDNVSIALATLGDDIVKTFDLKNVVKDISARLGQVTAWFKSLDDQVKKNILRKAALAAAIGPATLAFAKYIAVVKGVISVYGSLRVAALAANVSIKAVALTSIKAWVAAIAPIAGVTAALVGVGAAALYVYDNWKAFEARFQNIWIRIKNAVKDSIGFIIDKLNSVQKALGLELFDLSDFQQNKLSAEDLVDEPSFKSIGETIDSLKDKALGLIGLNVPLPNASPDKSGGAAGGIPLSPSTAGIGGSVDPPDPRPTVEAVDSISSSFDRMGERSEAALQKVAGGVTALSTMSEQAMGPLAKIFEAMTKSLDQMAESGTISFKKLGQAALDSARQMIVAAAKTAVASAISKTFASAPPFIAPFLAAAAGAAASALITRLVSSIKPPALAKGGLAFGPTLAVVGDNANASVDPEVISPLSKLQGMMNRSIEAALTKAVLPNTGITQFAPTLNNGPLEFKPAEFVITRNQFSAMLELSEGYNNRYR